MVALPIKSIQRGTISYDPSSSATGTATVTAVVVAKSELRMLGYTMVENSPDLAAFCDAIPRIALTNTTTITATSASTTAFITNVTISWELTEYY